MLSGGHSCFYDISCLENVMIVGCYKYHMSCSLRLSSTTLEHDSAEVATELSSLQCSEVKSKCICIALFTCKHVTEGFTYALELPLKSVSVADWMEHS